PSLAAPSTASLTLVMSLLKPGGSACVSQVLPPSTVCQIVFWSPLLPATQPSLASMKWTASNWTSMRGWLTSFQTGPLAASRRMTNFDGWPPAASRTTQTCWASTAKTFSTSGPDVENSVVQVRPPSLV